MLRTKPEVLLGESVGFAGGGGNSRGATKSQAIAGNPPKGIHGMPKILLLLQRFDGRMCAEDEGVDWNWFFYVVETARPDRLKRCCDGSRYFFLRRLWAFVAGPLFGR